MAKGLIEFITGPEHSGKTDLLIKKIADVCGRSLVLSPAFFNGDDFEMAEITTAEGISYPAFVVTKPSDLDELPFYDFIFVDDFHLFPPEIVRKLERLSMEGSMITACGERFDRQGNFYASSFLLMKRADMITELASETKGKIKTAKTA